MQLHMNDQAGKSRVLFQLKNKLTKPSSVSDNKTMEWNDVKQGEHTLVSKTQYSDITI